MIFKKVLQPNRWIPALPKMIKRMKSDIRNSKIMQKATASKIMGHYLSAFYTFYTMVISVLNLVKFRKLGSPILSAAKVLNFIAAMMSILGLQTAMISRFSENGEAYRKMMNTITGGFVYGIVIVIAITMLLHSKKSQKKVESIE